MPSDKANITYLSLVFKAFNQNKVKAKSLQTIGRTIDRARQIEEMKSELIKLIKQYHSDIEEAKKNVKVEGIESITDDAACRDHVKELFKIDRQNNAKFASDINKIEDKLEELNQARELYGQQAEYQLKGENTQEAMNQSAQNVH